MSAGGRSVYDIHDNEVHYTWLDRVFGPTITSDDLLALEFRAFNEGWTRWLEMVLGMRNTRKRRWMLAYLRDDIITVEVQVVRADVYEDENPYEGWGE